jgi:hypothetical protein
VNIDKLIGTRLRTAVGRRGGLRFGIRLGEFLGKEWSRQTVYDAGQGLRKFRVAELVAIARATNRPAHYFLDAASAGVETIELEAGAPTIDAEEIRNLFRIPEPQELSDTTRIALNEIEGHIEDLEAALPRLKWAAGLLRLAESGGES